MSLQTRGNFNFENFETPTSESRDKMTFGCWFVARHRVSIRGEGGGFPQVRAMVSFVSPCLPMIHSCTKNALVVH
jgi:hypothetical protein